MSEEERGTEIEKEKTSRKMCLKSDRAREERRQRKRRDGENASKKRRRNTQKTATE